METLSEEVCLVVKKVCLSKREGGLSKQEGALYLMAERVAWGPEGEECCTVSHLYADIRCPKISSDGRSKVQLQLVFHSGENRTFHFTDQSSALKDRDAAKELLMRLLPKFNKSATAKERPVPFQLDVKGPAMTSRVVSAEEFCANRLSTNNTEHSLPNQQEAVGISAAFLTDFKSQKEKNEKTQKDECGDSGYIPDSDITDSIFRTYPVVRQKYAEHVPHNLPEEHFWMAFSQSHYFPGKKDKNNHHAGGGTQDIFSECAKHDEKVFTSMTVQGVKNPLLDLRSLEDRTFGEGYRVSIPPSIPTKMVEEKSISSASIIRRFNRHSTMVLAAAGKPHTSGRRAREPGNADSGNPADDWCLSQPSSAKRAKLLEAIEYEDLRSETALKTVPLNLKESKYLRAGHGSTTSQEDIDSSISRVQREMSRYKPRLARVSATGRMSLRHAGEPTVPDAVREELRDLYMAVSEPLRRFWLCFPGGLNAPLWEERAAKASSDLRTFRDARLRPLQEKIKRGRLSGSLTRHLEDMIEAADNKFHSWQSRRGLKKRTVSCDGDERSKQMDEPNCMLGC